MSFAIFEKKFDEPNLEISRSISSSQKEDSIPSNTGHTNAISKSYTSMVSNSPATISEKVEFL